MQNIITNQIILPVISVLAILIALAYVIRRPFIREGSNKTKNVVAVAIGIMLTVLIVHLLPEVYSGGSSLSMLGININSIVFLFSLLCFYILGWTTHNHEHDDEHDTHTSKHTHSQDVESSELKQNGSYSIFAGQSIHSIADGVVIASSFAINIYLGIVTTIAISLHHIPMMSGVMIRSSKNKQEDDKNSKNLFWLTITSSAFMFIGVALFYIIKLEDLSGALLAIAAASFLYVGAYDLTSYLREYDDKKILKRVLFIFLGVTIGLMSQILNGENIINKNNNTSNIFGNITSVNNKKENIDKDEKEIFIESNAKVNTKIEYPKNNKAVKSWILDIYSPFKKDSDRGLSEYDNRPYEWDSSYEKSETRNYISYVYNNYTYTGGAHPLTFNNAYVINKKTNKNVENLKEVYIKTIYNKDGKSLDIYKYLESYSRADLKNQMTENGVSKMSDTAWLEEGTAATSTNYSAFWFENTSIGGAIGQEVLVIHFGQYQVAAYAMGMFQVKIPASELEKFK